MIQRILFPTDCTERSDAAEQYVMNLAEKTGAACLVLHVIEEVAIEGDSEVESLYERLEERAKPLVGAVAQRLGASGIKTEARVLVGKRWREIIATAKSAECDLIVIGTRRFSEDRQPLMGTTSHQVFLASPIPVLTVPVG